MDGAVVLRAIVEQGVLIVSRSSNPARLTSPPPSLPGGGSQGAELSCFEAFERELDYLRRTLRRLGVSHADIEDELHEVFLVLDRKWNSYDRSRPLRPYLFGIAFRVVAGHQRKGRREVAQVMDEFAQYNDSSPDEVLDAVRARTLVLAALGYVPLARRAVLVMHDIDEIPMKEITDSLSLPLFTGYSRLRRARVEFEAAVRALRNKARS